MKNFSVLLNENKKLAVWGTGSFYQKLLPDLRQVASISYLVDNNSQQWGKQLDGFFIASPEDLFNEEKNNVIVLVASSYYEQIEQKLIEYGFCKEQILCGEQNDILKELKVLVRNKRLHECSNFREKRIDLYLEFFELFSKLTYRNVQVSKIMNVEFCILLDYLLAPQITRILNDPPDKLYFKQNGNGKILAINIFPGRGDYLQLLQSAVRLIPKDQLTFLTLVNEEESDCIFGSSRSPKIENNVTLMFEECLNNFPLALSLREKEWLLKWVQAYLSYIDFVYNFLEKSSYTILLSVNEVIGFQNAFYQCMKLKNKKTVLLQHGLIPAMHSMYNSKKTLPLTEVSFTQCRSDRYFVWGEGFKKSLQTQGIHPESISVVGNPKYDLTLREREQFRKTSLFTLFKIAIFLPAPGSELSTANIDMIQIALKVARLFSARVIVKVHPNDPTNYEEVIEKDKDIVAFAPANETVRDILDQIDFLIISASTVFFESILFYIPVFIYDHVDAPALSEFIEYEITTKFTTSEELIQLVEHYSINYNEINELMNSISGIYVQVEEVKSSDKCKNILCNL